jgi:hypothetical protein
VEFFKSTLPGSLKQKYFLLYLLVLHQRWALTRLSYDVATMWTGSGADDPDQNREAAAFDASRREAQFRRLRDRLLFYAARGQFTQIGQQERLHRAYRHWMQTLQIEELFAEVRDEVREMHEFLASDRDHRLEQAAKEEQERLRLRDREERALADERRREVKQEEAAREARDAELTKRESHRASHLEKLIGKFALMLGLPSLFVAILQVTLTSATDRQRWWWSLGAVVVGLAVGWLLAKAVTAWALRNADRELGEGAGAPEPVKALGVGAPRTEPGVRDSARASKRGSRD